MNRIVLPAALGAVLCLTSLAHAATLDDVKSRGYVKCGTNTGLLGFAAPDDKGNWKGFDVDYCRAVAAAIFNDATKVRFSPLTATERFTALQSGEVDMLARNTTWTMQRDTQLGLEFAGVNYYDGQGFMVKKSLGVTSALELSGASVCVQTGTTTELNLADFFKQKNMTYKPVAFEKLDDVNAAYASGRCDAYTTDASGLYSLRLSQANPAENIVLPEIISKEPLGPAVRQGDDKWLNVVKWVHYTLIYAEELGVTSDNADAMKKSTNPNIQRLLGVTGDKFGQGIGLTDDWSFNVIKAVGNYGQIFDRNLGKGSTLLIARGLNALWTNGGLQYAMPVR